MKIYLMMLTVVVLSSFLHYEVQGIRLGKVISSASSHQEIIKISSIEGSNQDYELPAKTAEFSSGINTKLMIKFTSGTSITISKNQKTDGHKDGPKPEVKSTYEQSKHWMTEVAPEPYSDVIDLTRMDYTTARKKPPIHN